MTSLDLTRPQPPAVGTLHLCAIGEAIATTHRLDRDLADRIARTCLDLLETLGVVTIPGRTPSAPPEPGSAEWWQQQDALHDERTRT